MERLKGKTAMVVGAGSIGPGWGNGKATAATFAREGAQVFCVDRNAAAAKETVDIITGEGGKATAFTADVSQLYALRLNLAKPTDHDILPDVISKEPLAPVVRQRDDDWMMIVKWTLYAMINAEELGITSKNINEALKSKKPDVMRLVGTEGAYGEELGLTKDWAARIIRHVGNYGEVFERNVGSGSRLGIPRGLNQLWSAGGIQYAPPMR